MSPTQELVDHQATEVDLPIGLGLMPQAYNARLAQNPYEVNVAQCLAAQFGIRIAIISEPEKAETAYRRFTENYNQYCKTMKVSFGFNIQRCAERAREVTAENVGGAVLILTNPEGAGFDQFNGLYTHALRSNK